MLLALQSPDGRGQGTGMAEWRGIVRRTQRAHLHSPHGREGHTPWRHCPRSRLCSPWFCGQATGRMRCRRGLQSRLLTWRMQLSPRHGPYRGQALQLGQLPMLPPWGPVPYACAHPQLGRAECCGCVAAAARRWRAWAGCCVMLVPQWVPACRHRLAGRAAAALLQVWHLCELPRPPNPPARSRHRGLRPCLGLTPAGRRWRAAS